MPAYLPFLEALGAYIHAASQESLLAQAAPMAPTLATILPELADRLGEVALGRALPAEQARLRLFEAGGFLAAIAAQQPVLLIVDDLQWADPATLDLLVHLASHRRGERLLSVAAHRDDDPASTEALARLTLQLQRQRVLMVVPLGPLELGDVVALAATQLGGTVDSDLAERLHTHSDGNPFFAEELLRDWLDSGVVQRHGQSWTLAGGKDWSLPPGITGVIRQRLTRLPQAVVDELRTAAVLGRTFDIDLLAAVRGFDPALLEDHLLAAAAWGLVRREGPQSFAFCHDRTRECLYTEISETRRQRLHLAIGEALEASAAPVTPQHLAALAFHFARSGERARGALYSQRAAEQALYT